MSREIGKTEIERIKGEFSDIKERGEEIIREGTNVDSAIKNINMDGLDPDDIAAKETAINDYHKDFESEIQEDVTETTAEVQSDAKSEVAGLESDKSKVDEAKSEFTNIAGMSEIGSENADKAASKMEQSSSEYGDIINDGNAAMEKADEDARNLKAQMGGLL